MDSRLIRNGSVREGSRGSGAIDSGTTTLRFNVLDLPKDRIDAFARALASAAPCGVEIQFWFERLPAIRGVAKEQAVVQICGANDQVLASITSAAVDAAGGGALLLLQE